MGLFSKAQEYVQVHTGQHGEWCYNCVCWRHGIDVSENEAEEDERSDG